MQSKLPIEKPGFNSDSPFILKECLFSIHTHKVNSQYRHITKRLAGIRRILSNCAPVLVYFGHLFLLLAIHPYQPLDFGEGLSHHLASLFGAVDILDLLLSLDSICFQILIDQPCLSLPSNLHLPLVHLLLVLAANRVNSFIRSKALGAAVVLGQAA